MAGRDVQRIRLTPDSADIAVVTPYFELIGRRPVRRRNVSTKASIPLWRHLRLGYQVPAAFGKGFIDGFADGVAAKEEAPGPPPFAPAALTLAGAYSKCRRANEYPEPLFRYLSNRWANSSVSKAK